MVKWSCVWVAFDVMCSGDVERGERKLRHFPLTHLKYDSNRVVIYGDGNLPNQEGNRKRTEAEANTYKNKGYEMGSIILLLSGLVKSFLLTNV